MEPGGANSPPPGARTICPDGPHLRPMAHGGTARWREWRGLEETGEPKYPLQGKLDAGMQATHGQTSDPNAWVLR